MALTRTSMIVRRGAIALAAALVMVALAASAGVGAGTATWTGQRTLTGEGRAAYLSALAVGLDGTVHALLADYADGPYKLYATRHRPGGVWEEPVLLSEGDTSFGSIAVDGSGRAVAAWNEPVEGDRRVRTARRAPGGAWSVDGGYRSPDATHSGNPQIVADANGNVSAVWAQETEGTVYIVASRRTASGGWLPAPVTVSGANAQNPRLVVDGAGRVTAAWDRGLDELPGRVIESNSRTATGAWAAPAEALRVTDSEFAQTNPDLAVTPGGALVVVYTEDSAAMPVVTAARKAPGQPWVATAEPLSVNDATAEAPLVAVTPDGTAVATWVRSHSNNVVQAAVGDADGSWSDSVDLSPSDGDALSPDVVVDRRGVATVAWQRDAGSNISPIEARRYSDGTWGETVPLTHEDSSGGYDLRSAVDGQGNVVVGWSSSVGEVQARALDVAGPLLASVTAPKARFPLRDPVVRWTARDAWNAVTSYRVEVTSATPAGAFSARSTWLNSTILTSKPYGAAAQGETNCFTVRGIDTLGFLGTRSAARCVATPLNDRRLDASGAWDRKNIDAAYLGTASVASADGAVLKSDRVDAKRLALVATRAPDAGRVDVFFAGDLVKTISLEPTSAQNADKTYRKQVIPIVTFPGRRDGVVRIVTRNDRKVVIEGLGVSAR